MNAKYAIIDIGSNTVKLNVYSVAKEEDKLPVTDTLISQSTPVGLINYIVNGRLSDEGKERLIEVVEGYASLAADLNCSETLCAATAALRAVSNGYEVSEEIRNRTCCKFIIITGEEEAALSFEAVMKSSKEPPEQGFVIDMGGGSTEIVGFADGKPQDKISLPFGCLLLHNRFVSSILPTRKELSLIGNYVDTELKRAPWIRNYGNTAFLVGGTARAVGKLWCDETGKRLTNGQEIPVSELQSLYGKYAVPGKKKIMTMIRVIPDRLHTVVPGLTGYLHLFRAAGIQKVIISFAGVRDGLILRKADQLADRMNNGNK